MPGRIADQRDTPDGLPGKGRQHIDDMPDEGRLRAQEGPRASDAQEGPRHVASLFASAQRTTATHRTLVTKLRHLQADGDERGFAQEVARCVERVLVVPKSEAAGDRVVRFTGGFLKYASERDLSDTPPDDTLPDTPTSRLTTHLLSALLPRTGAKEKVVRYRATQLISHMINSLDAIEDELFDTLRQALLKRLRDREAVVRVQAVLALGRLAGSDGERSEASDTDSSSSAASGLLPRLLQTLQHDPSAEVRRTLLLNLPLTPSTLPYLLERARDADAPTRRALYSRLLPALGDFRHLSLSMREKLLRWGLRDRDGGVRGAAGRLFAESWIADCERTGREAGGAGPAGGAGHAGDARGVSPPPAQGVSPPPAQGVSPPQGMPPPPDSLGSLLELLERIDVVNSGSDGGVALEAMRTFWPTRPDFIESIHLGDAFWGELTAESVFVARSLAEWEEDKLPELTHLAFTLERYIQALVQSIRDAEAEDIEADEAGDTSDAEAGDTSHGMHEAHSGNADTHSGNLEETSFIVENLLHILLTLDYSDEVGRRKTFALLRDSLAIPELPEHITKLAVEVLRGVCSPDGKGEREFCGVVLEAVAEVHDTIEASFVSAPESPRSGGEGGGGDVSTGREAVDVSTAREGVDVSTGRGSSPRSAPRPSPSAQSGGLQQIMVNMKCLHIAQCMLENVSAPLQDNAHLVTMLNNLVVPAVRSHEAPIRERGLLCLGLCCLLDRTLAEENLSLFLHCFSKGHEALQVYALHIISDILTVHGNGLLSDDSTGPKVTKMYSRALKSHDKAEVQAASATALAKLLLTQTFPPAPPPNVSTDDSPAGELLRLLVVSYFDPSTADNLALRQALAYFLPVYAHSRASNQRRLTSVAIPALHALAAIAQREDDDDDADAAAEGGMMGLAAIAAQVVDWTDPRRLVGPGEGPAGDDHSPAGVGEDVHLDLAVAVTEKISGNCTRDERKMLAGMLRKIYVPPQPASVEKLRTLLDGLTDVIEEKVVSDAPGRNALLKLQAAVESALQAAPETTRTSSAERDPADEMKTTGVEPTEVEAKADHDREEAEAEAVEQEQEEEEAEAVQQQLQTEATVLRD